MRASRLFETIFCAATMLFAVGPAAGGSPSDYAACNQDADQGRSIAGCTRILDDTSETIKNRIGAYVLRGNAYYGKGDYDRAIADFSEAITLDPQRASTFESRANAYANKHLYDRALDDFDHLVRLQPTNAGALNSRCWYRTILGQLQPALSDCNKSLQLDPTNSNTLGFRGFTYLKLGQFEAAISDYDEYLRSNSKATFALFGRGMAKLKTGDTVGGEADMMAAKAIDPKVAATFAKFGVK